MIAGNQTSYMKYIIAILIFVNSAYQEPILSKVTIQDKCVISIIHKYDSLIKVRGWDEPYKQSLLIRIERDKKNQIIYLDCTNRVSTFENDVPDSYAEVGDRIVFIYKRKSVDVDDSKRFLSFYNQFGNIFALDITATGEYNDISALSQLIHTEKWRALYYRERLQKIKQIHQFPSHSFYNDYRYNKDGYIVYKDGVFASTEITPHQLEPSDFNLRKYILEKTSLTLEILRENEVTAIMVINEDGKISEVVIEGLINEQFITEIKQALFKMPAWQPSMIDNKRVKVRIRQGL